MRRTQISWAGGRAAAAIRSAGPADLDALSDFFTGLSAQTRYLRFFGPVIPGAALLRSLAGCAETIDAMVAVRGGVIVGHAMAADRIDPRGTRVTDIGVVVADAWQGRGLGAALMRAVVTGAQARGVALLEMDVLGHNRQVLEMITSHWPTARIEPSPDCVNIRIRLPQRNSSPPPPAVPPDDIEGHTALDAAARAPLGALDFDNAPAFLEPPALPEPSLRWGTW